MRSKLAAIALGSVICGFLPQSIQSAPNQCGKMHFENAEIRNITGDRSSLSIADCIQQTPGRFAECVCDPINAGVPANLRNSSLDNYAVGGHIWLDMDEKHKGDLAFLQAAPIPGSMPRLLVLAAVALLLLGVAAVLTGGRPLQLIVGQDNRYSNSKFQMAIWFWILLTSYLTIVVFRVYYHGWDLFGGITIPPNLLMISGVAALTYGGAKAITTAKADAAQAAAAAAPSAPVPMKTTQAPGHERLFHDLTQNDCNRFDFGDFQMIVITLLAVATFAVLFFHNLSFIPAAKAISLPDVDSTLLAAFGLGQGAYLTKKAAGTPGNS